MSLKCISGSDIVLSPDFFVNLRKVTAGINFELDNCLKQKDAPLSRPLVSPRKTDWMAFALSQDRFLAGASSGPLSPRAEPVSSHFPPVEALHPSALYKHQLVAKVTSIKDSRGNSSVQSIFSSSVEDHRQHEAFCK